jgi:hypothetical protein
LHFAADGALSPLPAPRISDHSLGLTETDCSLASRIRDEPGYNLFVVVVISKARTPPDLPIGRTSRKIGCGPFEHDTALVGCSWKIPLSWTVWSALSAKVGSGSAVSWMGMVS